MKGYCFYASHHTKCQKLAAPADYAKKYESHFESAKLAESPGKRIVYISMICSECGAKSRADCAQYLCKRCCGLARRVGGRKKHSHPPLAESTVGGVALGAMVGGGGAAPAQSV